MKEWTGTLQKNDIEFLSSYAPLDEILLFDIETTGLSAKTSYCYMIGYCYLEKMSHMQIPKLNTPGTIGCFLTKTGVRSLIC